MIISNNNIPKRVYDCKKIEFCKKKLTQLVTALRHLLFDNIFYSLSV